GGGGGPAGASSKPCTCMTWRIRFRLQPVRKVRFAIAQTADGRTPRGYRHRPNLLQWIKEGKPPPTGPGSPVIGFKFGCCSTSSPTTSGNLLHWLALPLVQSSSLTSLHHGLFTTGGPLIRHCRP